MSRELSVEGRRRLYEKAEARVGAVAVRWLDARVLGPVPAGLDRELEQARRAVRRAQDRLTDTKHRLAKRGQA